MVKVFISQSAIDAWVSRDKVDVSGDLLTLREGVALRLTPASLFRQVATGMTDVHGLVGRVKAEEAMSALGAEAYMSSVILGDTGYDVDPGFVGTPVDGAGADTVLGALHALVR